MATIELPISSEPITGFKRIARHETLIVWPTLEMTQEIRVIMLSDDGTPIASQVDKLDLPDAQKQSMALRYADQRISRRTEGAFVDAKTGAVVDSGTEGAISQLQYFQSITLGDLKRMGLSITDKTPFAQLFYAIMGNEIARLKL
jgi:hypothetical protein